MTKENGEGRLLPGWRGKAMVAVASLALSFAIAEAVVRRMRLDDTCVASAVLFQQGDIAVHRPSADPVLQYELRPGATCLCADGGSKRPPYRVTIDASGARAPAHAAVKGPGVFRVLAYGGSTLYGAGVNDEETTPAALERHLNLDADGGRVEVWNFGTPGYTLLQEAHLARSGFATLAPDLILIHLHNRGPRPRMLPPGTDTRDVRELSRDDPYFIGEHFPPPEWLPARVHAFAFEHSAVYRAFAGLSRHRARQRDPFERIEYSDSLDRAEARLLEREAEARGVPVFYVELPPVPGSRRRGCRGWRRSGSSTPTGLGSPRPTTRRTPNPGSSTPTDPQLPRRCGRPSPRPGGDRSARGPPRSIVDHGMDHPPRGRGAALLLALATGSIGLIAVELSVRIGHLDFRIITPSLYYQGADVPVHRYSDDPALHYELKPGSHYEGDNPVCRPPRHYEVHIDENGARFPPHAAARAADTFRILAFGGSTLYGGSVNDAETLPAALERRLNARGGAASDARRFEVWNFGTSAYTLGQAALLARQKLPSLDPDLILMQLHNRGCWPFLVPRDGRIDRYPSALLEADPHFYRERFTRPRRVPQSMHDWMLRHVAIYRALLGYAARRSPCNQEYSEELSAAEARALTAEGEARGVPVVYLAIPADRQRLRTDLVFPGLEPERFIELFRPGREPDFYDVHPAAPALDEIAGILLERLDALGLLQSRRGAR